MYSFKKFKDKRKKFCLRGNSFVLPELGIVCVKGDVGSGKTTFLKDLYSGKIKRRKGKKLYLISSYIPVGFSIIDKYTGLDYLNRYMNLFCIDENKFFSLCEELKISEILSNLVSDYSDGELFRFRLALYFAQNNSIYLIDEPTARLDSSSSKIAMNVIERQSKESLILISTHDLNILKDHHSIEVREGKMTFPPEFNDDKKCNNQKVKKRTHKGVLKNRKVSYITSIFSLILGIISGLLVHKNAEIYFPTEQNYALCSKKYSKYFLTQKDNIYSTDYPLLLKMLKEETFFISPKEFNMVYMGQTIDIEKLQEKIPYIDNLLFINTDEKTNSVKISTGLKKVLKYYFTNFNEKNMVVNGLSCLGTEKDNGLAIYIPKSLVFNAILNNPYAVQDTRLVFDENGNSVELNSNSVAVEYSKFNEKKGQKMTLVNGKEYTINSYFISYEGKEYVFAPTEDILYESIFELDGQSSLREMNFYSEKSSAFRGYQISVREKENYISYLKSEKTDVKFIAFLLVSFITLSLSFCASYYIINSHKKKIELDLLDIPSSSTVALNNINWFKIPVVIITCILVISFTFIFNLIIPYFTLNYLREIIVVVLICILDILFSLSGYLLGINKIKKRML